MEPRSCLKEAVCLLKELHDVKAEDLEAALREFARCQWVSLRENDLEGCFWSAKLVQGIIGSRASQEAPDEVFRRLLQILEAESGETGEQEVESQVALGAFHVGSWCEGRDAQAAETWFTTCLKTVKTDYLRYLASLGLGKLLLVQSSRQEDALKWFQAAKDTATAMMASNSLITLASYYVGKALSKLGRYKDASACLKNTTDGKQDSFIFALVTMLDADVKRLELGGTVAPHEVLATYEKARIQLAGSFLVSLEKKLAEYVGSSCCSCLLLVSYLRLDQFSRFAMVIDAKQGPGIQIELCFYAWELYRDARCEMINLQEELGVEYYMDPKPHLEQAIEYMYSTKRAPEKVPLALDSLVISQQISSKSGNLSGLYWAGAFLDDYIGSGYEDIASRLIACFKHRSMDDEAPEAWAYYYLGRVGSEDGLVSEAQHEQLKESLKRTRRPLLGYHVAYALGNAAGSDFKNKAEMMERMKAYALQTGNEELIIISMLELYYTMLFGQKIEKAEQIQSELMQWSSKFCSSYAAELGNGVAEFMDGMRRVSCLDYMNSLESLKRAVGILGPLNGPRASLVSYLQTKNECLSHQGMTCLQLTYANATRYLVQSESAANSKDEIPLYSVYDEGQAKAQALEARRDLLEQDEDLDRADEEAQSLLEKLKTEEYTYYVSRPVLAYLASRLLRARALIAFKRFEKEKNHSADSAEAVVDLIGRLMGQALEAAKSCLNAGTLELHYLGFHGKLLYDLGRKGAAIEKLELMLRSFMALDPDFGQVSSGRIAYVDGVKQSFRLLQRCFYEMGDLQRALIWSEREHTRDFMYKGNLQDLSAFDDDDEQAWLDIESISIECGKDTVILVINHLNIVCDMLLCFLLHDGKIVKHNYVADKFISVTVLLDLIYGSYNELEQHEQLTNLYDILIAPFAQELQKIQPSRIIFAPSQDLALLPYSALRIHDDQGGRFLIESYSVSIVPSLRLLKHCTRRLQDLGTSQTDRTGLVVGNPRTPGFPDLPSAIEEAQQVSAALDQAGFATVLQLHGAEPTKQVTLSLLPNFSWIHLACHCKVNDQFPEGALILAAEEEQQDELDFSLTSQEIADKCRLRAFAAILSACSSGRSRMVHSAEGIMALPRSFHMTGVPSVVMSLWTVDDEPTQQLMNQLYSNLLLGLDLGDALQRAIAKTIRQNDFVDPPIRDWAPFIISGSPFTSLKLI